MKILNQVQNDINGFYFAKNIMFGFKISMKIPNLKSYLTTPYKCFIPRCKAHCCINVPLPEKFYEQNRFAAQRPVFSIMPMTNFAYGKPYKAEVCNTSPVHQAVGFDKNGDLLHGVPSPTLEAFGVKTQEDLELFLKQNGDVKNYCPFITDYCRCAVYDRRPPICHEFGTMPGKINYCPDKSSRLDIIKFVLKSISPKIFVRNVAHLMKQKFKTA